MVVGDWSNDGHGQTETLVIESNLSHEEIEAAYAKGVKEFGLDVARELCHEYEENTIPRELYKRFEMIDPNFGDKYADSIDHDPTSEDIAIWHKEFTAMWLIVAQCGNPDFKWRFSEAVKQIFVGGHGLFS